MPPQQKVLDFYVRMSFPRFHPPPTLSRTYNITERLAANVDRATCNESGWQWAPSLHDKNPDVVKKEPLPREYLTFDPETHSPRLLERGWSQNEA